MADLTLSEERTEGGVGGREEQEEGRERELRLLCKIKEIAFKNTIK